METAESGVEDDEYEYEYDETRTETFFVDLDLSSLNGTPESRTLPRVLINPWKNGNTDPNQVSNGGDLEASDEDGLNPAFNTSRTHRLLQSIKSIQGPRDLQIIDIETPNPIVCFNDQIYGCSWTDLVGTNLFFGPPGIIPEGEAVRDTSSWALIGTSRIKLLGHRARLSKTDAAKTQQVNEEALEQDSPDGRGLPGFVSTNPQTNVEIKRQADFLERLMGVKRARKEPDLVTVIPS